MGIKLAVLDFETDPFKHGSTIAPFVWDLYDGETHVTFWGADCLPVLIDHLKSLKSKLCIYAHNGGKFDFMFLLKWIRGEKMLVINNRIVSAELCGHDIRDSFAAIPVPLRAMEKDDIDYKKMGARRRENHRPEIIKYLYKDTESLFKFISAYREMFGHKAVTMASAAIRELKKFHTYEVMSPSNDEVFREYFHGGRVECFQTGVVKTPLKVYDVNSMYPSVMLNFLHPISATPLPGNRVHKKTCFVEWSGYSAGAMPQKDNVGSLRFPHGSGTWKCSIHEFEAGLETGTIKVEKVLKTWEFLERATFAEFIEHFYSMRLDAKSKGDDVNTLFYKLVMNSAYGKFAQNPREFKDYLFTDLDKGPEKRCVCDSAPACGCGGWRLACEPCDGYLLWCKPAVRNPGEKGFNTGWHNVATAASITGAARSLLLRAIVKASNPLYCYTDSLICGELNGVEIDSKKLGAWKFEKSGTVIAIAGKKMYSVFSPEKPEREEKETLLQYDRRIDSLKWNKLYANKIACKGVRLTPAQIVAVSKGYEVEYANQAPTMKFDGRQNYIKRRVNKTV